MNYVELVLRHCRICQGDWVPRSTVNISTSRRPMRLEGATVQRGWNAALQGQDKNTLFSAASWGRWKE